MQTSGTCHRLFAFVIFTLKWRHHATTQHYCADIRFLNHQNDVIYSAVNSYINITFAVDWVNCSLSTNEGLVKVVANVSGLAVDECKLPATKGVCHVSDNTPCFCVTPAGPITLMKRLTKVVNMTFVWLWSQGEVKKEKVLTVRVVEVSSDHPDGEAYVPTVNSTQDPIYYQVLIGGVIACSVVVVVGIIGGIIVCYRLRIIRRLPQAEQRPQNSAKGSFSDGRESNGQQLEGLYDDLFCSTKL